MPLEAAALGRSAAPASACPPAPSGAAPDPCPTPSLPEGTDTLPQIDHIVVVMQENHSFDNYLGMLGRGDGFTLDRHGRPTNTNPDPSGGYVRAFHETDTCQAGNVTQTWNASHIQYGDGRNDGFIGPESSSDWSMAYYTEEEIPFYYSLAGTFPVCDRYFCSVLAQTYPNRRFLLAGTAFGLIATEDSSITRDPAERDHLRPSRRSRHQLGGLCHQRLHALGDLRHREEEPGRGSRRSTSSTPMPNRGRCRRSPTSIRTS